MPDPDPILKRQLDAGLRRMARGALKEAIKGIRDASNLVYSSWVLAAAKRYPMSDPNDIASIYIPRRAIAIRKDDGSLVRIITELAHFLNVTGLGLTAVDPSQRTFLAGHYQLVTGSIEPPEIFATQESQVLFHSEFRGPDYWCGIFGSPYSPPLPEIPAFPEVPDIQILTTPTPGGWGYSAIFHPNGINSPPHVISLLAAGLINLSEYSPDYGIVTMCQSGLSKIEFHPDGAFRCRFGHSQIHDTYFVVAMRGSHAMWDETQTQSDLADFH